MKFGFSVLASASLLVAAFATSARAVDLDAGDYDPGAAGATLALVYLQHAERDAQYTGSQRAPGDNRLTSDISIFRFVHYVDIAGLRVAPQVLIPYGRFAGKGDQRSLGKTSGVGDIILAAPVWFVNRPKEGTYFGVTPYLFLPTGGYESTRALNLGEDRWKLNLQAAGSIHVLPKLAVDAGADVTFYGKTGQGYAGGRMKQDAGYQIQTSARYFINPKVDLRAGISHAEGGNQTQNSLTSRGFQQTKFWVGSAVKPSATSQVILTYGRDLDVKNGFREENRINVRLLQAF